MRVLLLALQLLWKAFDIVISGIAVGQLGSRPAQRETEN